MAEAATQSEEDVLITYHSNSRTNSKGFERSSTSQANNGNQTTSRQRISQLERLVLGRARRARDRKNRLASVTRDDLRVTYFKGRPSSV
eukprot:6184339-Pleurochrysis_carterae.AAC.4